MSKGRNSDMPLEKSKRSLFILFNVAASSGENGSPNCPPSPPVDIQNQIQLNLKISEFLIKGRNLITKNSMVLNLFVIT